MIQFQSCHRRNKDLLEDDVAEKLDGNIPAGAIPGAEAGAGGFGAGGAGGGGNPPAAKPPVEKTNGAGKPAAEKTDPPPVQFNEAEYFKKNFGDEYDAVDKVKNRLTRIAELETELNTVKSADPLSFIKDDYIRGLVKATNDGISRDAYEMVASVDPEKLSEKDALVTRMMWEHGYKKDDAEFLVNEKYKLDPSLNAEDPGVRLARLDFQAESKKAKGWIVAHKAEVLVPPAVTSQLKTDAQIEKVAPVVKELANSLKSFKWDEKDDKPFTFKDDVVKRATEFVLESIKTGGIEIDINDKDYLEAMASEIQIAMIREVGFKNVISHYMAQVNNKDLSDTNNSTLLKDLNPDEKSRQTKKEKDAKVISQQIRQED